MPRKLRIQYPGAMYHLMSRSDWSGRIGDGPGSREGFEQRMEKRRIEEPDLEIFEPLRGVGLWAARAFARRC